MLHHADLALVSRGPGRFCSRHWCLRTDSVAREEQTAQSDVDVLVIGKTTLDQVLSRLSPVEKSIGRPVNPTVYSVEEFRSRLAKGNHFLTAVLKGQKVFLLGDEDELRKVGGVRLAKARTNQS